MTFNVLSLGIVGMDQVIECDGFLDTDGFTNIRDENNLPGGSCANVSVTAGSLGLNVFQSGKIGTDEFGKRFRDTLIEDGVDDRFLVTQAGGITMHTYILNFPNGEHSILVNSGNTMNHLKADELPENVLDNIDLFFCDLYSPDAAIFVAKKAQERNIPIVFHLQTTASFMNDYYDIKYDTLQEMLGMSNLFVTNEMNLMDLENTNSFEEALKNVFTKYKIKEGVVCTRGSLGAYWYDGILMNHGGFSINPIDSTGAGDSFIGGLLYSYFYKKLDKADSLKFSNAVASIKCLNSGPRYKVTASEVEDFIINQKEIER